jgi:hypothetical protein
MAELLFSPSTKKYFLKDGDSHTEVEVSKSKSTGDTWYREPGGELQKHVPDGAWNAVKEFSSEAIEYAKGNRSTEGYPELPDQFYQRAKKPQGGETSMVGTTAARMSTSPADAGKLDIFLKMREESGQPLGKEDYGFDKHGNAWVIPNDDGKKFYLNKPGVSGQDAWDVGTMLGFQMPFARAGGGAAKTLVGKMVGTGTGLGTGSVVQDVAAGQVGSEQGIDPQRAGMAVGLGALFEGLSPAASALWRMTVKNPVLYASGKLTEAGKKVLEKAGMTKEQISDDFAREFAKRMETAADPQAAAASADAASLPVPVPLKRGQQTLSAGDQMFDDLAQKGSYGPVAENITKGKTATQEEALAANIDAIQGRVGGSGITNPQQAGEAAQASLSTAERAAKRGVDDAYTTARNTNAGVEGTEFIKTAFNIERAAASEATPATAPSAFSLIDDLKGLSGGDRSVLLKEVYLKRQQLSNLRGANNADAVAAGAAVKAIDSEMERLLVGDLIKGNPIAVKAWKTAIGLAKSRFRKFYGGGIVEKLVTRTKGPGGELKVAPEQATNAIFGGKTLFGANATKRSIVHLRKTLGKDSAEWGMIKEAAWLRIAESSQGGVTATGKRALSGANFAKGMDRAMKEYGSVMKTMFTDQELSLMQSFKRTLARVTIPVKGGANFSNTTPALMNVMQTMLSTLFFTEGAAARWMAIPLVKAVYQGGAAVKAIPVAAGRLQKRGIPGGVTGGTLAAPTNLSLGP